MGDAPDPEVFREVFGRFATGVAVVTSAGSAGTGGLTANAICSLSLEPLLTLVCLENGARTLPIVRESGRFAVNILSSGQEELAGVFASKLPEAEKLDAVAHRLEHGVPIISGSLAWAACTLRELIGGGDHTIAIGEVVGLGLGDGEPLLWYGGRYHEGTIVPGEGDGVVPELGLGVLWVRRLGGSRLGSRFGRSGGRAVLEVRSVRALPAAPVPYQGVQNPPEFGRVPVRGELSMHTMSFSPGSRRCASWGGLITGRSVGGVAARSRSRANRPPTSAATSAATARPIRPARSGPHLATRPVRTWIPAAAGRGVQRLSSGQRRECAGAYWRKACDVAWESVWRSAPRWR